MDEMILRDYLAVDRTRLANQRTLLSMLRTALYFVVTGLSIMSLEAFESLKDYSYIFFIVGSAILALGVYNYYKNEKKINEMYKEAM